MNMTQDLSRESLRSHSYKRWTWPSPEITGGMGGPGGGGGAGSSCDARCHTTWVILGDSWEQQQYLLRLNSFKFPGQKILPQQSQGTYTSNWRMEQREKNVCCAVHRPLLSPHCSPAAMYSENNFTVSEVSSFFPFASFVLFLAIYPLMIKLKLQLDAIWRALVLV